MEQAGFALERRCHIARSPRPDLVQRLGRVLERDLLMLQYRPARCAGLPYSLGRTRGPLDRAPEILRQALLGTGRGFLLRRAQQSVVWGNIVSVWVVLCGIRIIKKQTNQ